MYVLIMNTYTLAMFSTEMDFVWGFRNWWFGYPYFLTEVHLKNWKYLTITRWYQESQARSERHERIDLIHSLKVISWLSAHYKGRLFEAALAVGLTRPYRSHHTSSELLSGEDTNKIHVNYFSLTVKGYFSYSSVNIVLKRKFSMNIQSRFTCEQRSEIGYIT